MIKANGERRPRETKMNRKKTYSGAEKEKCNIDKEVQKHNDCQCKKENKTITKKSVERTLVTFWFFFAL